MEQQSNAIHFTSAGFWLPCYQSSFFSRKEDDTILHSSYEFSATHLDPYANRAHIKLDTDIFTRLLMVLPRKGYTSAYPIFPDRGSIDESKSLPDPVAVLFLAKDFANLPPETTAQKWHPGSIGNGVFQVALAVNRQGFYIWTVAYQGRENHMPEVQRALKEHIGALVGGAFASKHSGRTPAGRTGSGKQFTEDDVPPENLRQYRDNDIGMLTFFQINTVLEGLHNVNLDPRMFFRTDFDIESDYALGPFVEEITATFSPYRSARELGDLPGQKVSEQEIKEQERRDEDAWVTIRDFFKTYWQKPESLRAPDRQLVTGFVNQTTYPRALAIILDEFLIKTEVLTLKTLKKRIERCRRALLDELIEVTHRRDPLVQAEPPDGPIDRIEDVTEAQLRGYVMLISAKLPLIANVLLHLHDLHYDGQTHQNKRRSSKVLDDRSIADPESKASVVFGPFHSWAGLLHAIQSDLQSLIEAINQARTDRMLYEQEQIHAEQETLAEIARLKDRTGDSIGSGASATISIISNLLALVAVLIAAGTLLQNGQLAKLAQQLFSAFNINGIPGLVELLIGIALLVALYVAITVVTGMIIRWLTRVIRRDLRLESQFYYELDAHVDAPFKAETLPSLLHQGIPIPPAPLTPFMIIGHAARTIFRRLQRAIIYSEKATLPEMPENDCRHFVTKYERNSYRVERLEKSEALHKIYVEANLRVNVHRTIRAVLVYEILYHRPAKDHDFIFKDLRVVSTHAYELTLDEIVTLKKVLTLYFINPCLEKGWPFVLPPKEDAYDALFTVTEPLTVTEQITGPVRPAAPGIRLGWAFTWPRFLLWGR